MTSERLDLRLLPAAVVVWAVTAWGLGWPLGRSLVAAVVLTAAGGCLGLARNFPAHPRHRRAFASAIPSAIAATMLLGAAAFAVAGLRAGAVHVGPLPELAEDGAHVDLVGVVTRDPVERDGQFGPSAVLQLRTSEVTGRGLAITTRAPLLVLGDDSWIDLSIGDEISASGRLASAEDVDLTAVLFADPDPHLEHRAGWIWRSVDGIRNGVWAAVAPVPRPQQTLIPALVDGDDSQISDELETAFMTTGLTHLLAVSGSNLTLVLAFVLMLARWAGVRGHWAAATGVVTVLFFVLLARPEPSVLRAAAMGLVGLAGLSAGGPRRGLRALCVAVIVLILFDPWLARSTGFLLSALATAGIVVLAGPWSRVLRTWVPGWLAEAVAVPLSAQLVCTPVIAAISGQVSMVAVFANLAAAPAVGPTTVLGLIGGIVEPVISPVGQAIGWCAGVPAWWIVTVAQKAAAFDGASLGWSVSPGGLVTLTGLCLLTVWLLPWVLRRPTVSLTLAMVLVLVVLRPWGRLGWPPDEWLLVVCDVGQGDALVLNVAPRAAVVIDAGPAPALVDRCLDDLDIEVIPVAVLTHFHADHVDGLPGVLDGREVSEVVVSPVALPSEGAAAVDRWTGAADIPVSVAQAGDTWSVGGASWQVLGPLHGTAGVPVDESSDDGSVANNASVVLRVELGGHTLLLAGDAEPEEEGEIAAAGGDLEVEIVKVSHHGSSRQDPEFYAETGASLALISVGADNDYGHPAPETLELLEGLGMDVHRTDQDGTIAVVDRDGELAVMSPES